MDEDRKLGPIVSSEHLMTPEGWRFSELEYGMIMAFNAFSRWMTRCMAATGYPDFNPLDVLVLHNLNHRKREKRLTDVAFVLNIEDLHTVSYSVKKLLKADLVAGQKRGKEMFYATTEKGRKACADYGKLRELCLIGPARAALAEDDALSDAARVLRGVSGAYDQASRAAASL